MKAIIIYKAGPAEQLQIEERPIPTLKEGWTLVKVKGFEESNPALSTKFLKSNL
jgi:oxidoreductase, putative